MPACRYVEENGSAIMLATKRLGVAPEVNFREHVTCMPPQSINKAAHSGFETLKRYHQKSKAGVLEAPQKKDLCPQKFFLKKKTLYRKYEYYLPFFISKASSSGIFSANSSVIRLFLKNDTKLLEVEYYNLSIFIGLV